MSDAYVCMFAKLVDRDSANVIKKGNQTALQLLENLVRDLKAGKSKTRLGFTVVDDSGTEPVGSVVVATNPSGGKTLTFDFMGGSVVLTAGTDFEIGANANATASNLSECINAHPQLGTLVSATVATDTVTLTAPFPGNLLENVDMAQSAGAEYTLTQIGAGTAGVDGVAEYFFQGKHTGVA